MKVKNCLPSLHDFHCKSSHLSLPTWVCSPVFSVGRGQSDVSSRLKASQTKLTAAVFNSPLCLRSRSSQLLLEVHWEETASRDPDLISSSYSSSANPPPPYGFPEQEGCCCQAGRSATEATDSPHRDHTLSALIKVSYEVSAGNRSQNSHPDGCWYEASEDGSFVSLCHGDKFLISVQLNELPLNCCILNRVTSDHIRKFGELVDGHVVRMTSADWDEDEGLPNSRLFCFVPFYNKTKCKTTF